MSIKRSEQDALNSVLKGLDIYDDFINSTCKGYNFTNCVFGEENLNKPTNKGQLYGKGGIIKAENGNITFF